MFCAEKPQQKISVTRTTQVIPRSLAFGRRQKETPGDLSKLCLLRYWKELLREHESKSFDKISFDEKLFEQKHLCTKLKLTGFHRNQCTVWPDWEIYGTLGNFLKTLATINLPKSSTFLGNFCKGVKIYFSSEIIFGLLFIDIGQIFWSHCECYQRVNAFFNFGHFRIKNRQKRIFLPK